MTSRTQRTTNDNKQGGKRVEIDTVKHNDGTCHPDILERVKEILDKE